MKLKVGDLVMLFLDDRIGIVTNTHVPLQPGLVEVLFNNNRYSHVQPYYLKVINESR